MLRFVGKSGNRLGPGRVTNHFDYYRKGIGVKFTNLLTAGTLMSAMVMPVAMAADATSITATAATIAKVMYDFILLLQTKIKTITSANILATTKIL